MNRIMKPIIIAPPPPPISLTPAPSRANKPPAKNTKLIGKKSNRNPNNGIGFLRKYDNPQKKGTSAKKNAALEKIKSLSESIQTLQKAIILSENTGNFDFSKEKVLYLYKNILKEIKNLSSNSIIKSDTDILKEYFKLNKELENMSRRRSNRKYLNESLEDLLEMDLFEADEDEDQEDFDDNGSELAPEDYDYSSDEE